ncbi:helix-turn-helix domain-containing protein [Pseudorhodoferax sp. Leaf274]|uniref:helix-turn-helix domain-containing protein n=1 Tax=Pseudorhodoferax sp. Leaf274 TaxID=1736318 RepID=UPI00070328BF|nr:helix-turn-helix domain-containing protein [Pseudorhodoferax sp. Leaf274]KQP37450.1 transposase [Pseudorhodoferax sp. Leaf274]
MRQVELQLTPADRVTVEQIRSKGVHHAREVNRAHVLWCLDQGIPEARILEVLGVGRTALWRARAAYLQGGVERAVFDLARSGRPRRYGPEAEARVMQLVASKPPEGRQRWTLLELERAARQQFGMGSVNRETVRRILKRSSATPAAAS